MFPGNVQAFTTIGLLVYIWWSTALRFDSYQVWCSNTY